LPNQKNNITPVAVAVGLAMVAVAAIGVTAYERAGDQLLESASSRYLSVMQLRRDALGEHMEEVARDTQYWAGDRAIREILADLTVAWNQLGRGASQKLRRAYLTENPNPVGERHQLVAARDGSDYSALHGAHHDWMRRFLEQHGYYDVFLVTPGGDVVYTAYKEDDFGTNLEGGTYRESGLGQAFRGARDKAKPGSVVFADFAPYAPSQGAPAAFAASPVLAEDGTLLGVLAFQIAIEPIDQIMQAEAGLGDDGETYAVGPDLLMRSDSPLSATSTMLKTRVDTPGIRAALMGNTGIEVGPSYRGIPVLTAYGPLEFMGHTWAIAAEVGEADVLAPIRRLRNFLVVSTVVAIVIISAIVGIALSLGLNRPAPVQPAHARHKSVG
jgi:methyl-accepting chemotaxis protein